MADVSGAPFAPINTGLATPSTYALGRGTEFYDKCAINEVSERLAKNGYKFEELIVGIIESVPFQKRRGEG